MNTEALAKLVKDMRQAQRLYFKDKRLCDLETSKRLEREVDSAVESVLNPQPDLFGSER